MVTANHCRSVRLSLFQITAVIIGCAIISFRTGLVIHNFRRIPPDGCKSGIHSNVPFSARKRSNPPFANVCDDIDSIKDPISDAIIDSGTCNSSSIDNDESVRKQPATCHAHRENISIASWLRVKSMRRRDKEYKAHVEFYEAMVHPSLLIHPNPNRIVVVHDHGGGQILQQVLKHKMVQEVIYLIPSALKTTFLATDTSDPRVVVVYVDDPIPYFRLSLPIDVVYMDAAMYVYPVLGTHSAFSYMMLKSFTPFSHSFTSSFVSVLVDIRTLLISHMLERSVML